MLTERFKEIFEYRIMNKYDTCIALGSECCDCPIHCSGKSREEVIRQAKLLLNIRQDVIAEEGSY